MVSSKALPEDFNPQFRSKFNHGFTTHGCFHCATLKALSSFKEKQDRKSIFLSKCSDFRDSENV